MRKDAKFGLVLGGILLAVMVLYLIVSSGSGNKGQQVQILDDSGKPLSAEPAAGEPGNAENAPAVEPPIKAEKTDPTDKTDKPRVDVFADSTAKNSKPDDAQDVWAVAFRTGKLPTLMTETPQPQSPQAPQGSQRPANETPAASSAESPEPIASVGHPRSAHLKLQRL